MQQVRGEHRARYRLYWLLGGLILLTLLIGPRILLAAGPVPVPITATATVDFTATVTAIVTATPTNDNAATAVGSTATAVSSTATALSSTATAQAAQGTIISIGATQTALAATITALASTPLATFTPLPPVSPTATPVPCLDRYEPDGEPHAAQPLVVGEQQLHLLCPAGDADWVTFFAKAGKAYRLATTDLSPGVDTYVYLFAPDGRTVLAENDDAPGAHGPSLLVWGPPADGWYFLQIKNQGDIGAPGLAYTLSLNLADAPTATLTSTAAPSATATPLLPATSTLTVHPTLTPSPVPAALSTLSATPDPLLHPQAGSAGTGGVPAIAAGPLDGLTPDLLEPDDRFEEAHPLDLGMVYQHLNFVPATPGANDADFYSFRTKPGNCYALTTGDLTAGLDTTILLWTAAPTREGRRLLAQNDDARPHTADLSSFVRWCNPLSGPDDRWLVAEIHPYGQMPPPDPRGKTYSLLVAIDPPTMTPTATARPSPPALPAPGGGGSGGPGPGSSAGGSIPLPASTPVLAPIPTLPWDTPNPTPVGVQVTPTLVNSPFILPTLTMLSSPTPAATPTAPPSWVQVDVVAYVAPPADLDPQRGPQPDDGIQGVLVLLIDAPTNAVVQTATTDRNGHAALRWAWVGPVRVALPAFRWGRSLAWADVQQESQGTGHLYLEARSPGYLLPGIFP